MGNQLTGIAPSQILPVEHYLQDVSEYEYESNLGSTRFFKVARARYGEGLVVVKVFVIHDPSLPLKIYRDRLGDIARRLANASNVLPFQKETVSDKAAMLFRQYVKDSLYDRISTRPFLSTIEKQFMAFQLLCALNQCHKLDICHGDIKSENVMVTSWNWLLLADFASFKPTYLPEDNPADFSYFFDTSRRRTCYLAPERFVESSWASSDSVRDTGGDDLPTASNIKKGDLTTAMDIFSAGCVITELFTEGKPPFDLSQLLSYRTGEYSPKELIQDIDNVYVRDLVRHMMQKDPKLRFTTEEYMVNQKGKAFPDYFYSFLKTYLQKFAATPIISPDDRVMRIKQDISLILEKMQISKTDLDENTCLVMIISLVTATIRNLHFLISKLTALDIMLELSKYVTSDIVLDRVIPFMLYMVNDSFPQVRADAIRTITLCLSGIKSVPLSDANIFPEYILPQMSHLTQDYVISVRVAYAENIALLSETASRFLEIVQLTTQPLSISPETSQEMSHYKASYDIELQALHDMIQQKVVTLLSDHENIVKQTLLENGITRLCVFFGRQKANDVLLSHMITFLNNKKDWHLRGAFFDAIVGITAYVGWHSSTILKPLLQQGLSDTEEFVINKTLTALQALVEMSLIQKPMKYELLHEVCPFLCHPNTWIRQGAAGFVSAMARTMNIADVHCNLLPVIKPYLKQDILQVEKELMLLHCLSDPIPRTVYDFILRSNNIDRLFKTLEQRQMMRQLARPGHSPNYSELDNTMSTMFRKLQSEGMQREDEDKLYAMRDFMMKLHKSRADSSKNENVCRDGDLAMSGAIDLGSLPVVTKRHADLLKIGDPKADLNLTIKKPQTKRKVHALESPTTLMNEDWKQMFGSSDIDRSTIKARKDLSNLEAVAEGVPSTSSQYRETQYGVQSLSLSVSQLQTSSDKKGKSKEERAPSQSKYASSKLDLRRLVYHKKSLFSGDQITKDLLDTVWESRPPPVNWKPRGILVAHLHEHRGGVNRVRVNQDHKYFATCSNDGSVKVFDSQRMEGKSVTNRSRMTYNKQDGQIKTLTFCDNSQSVAFVADKGDSCSLNVFRIEPSGSHKYTVLLNKPLDVEKDGMVVDLLYFDTGSQNILTYATVNGNIIGWDMRTSKEVWRLQNDTKQGLITSFDIHPKLSWMVLGTSSGTMTCWDMRFHLPVTSIVHPTGARVRRCIAHPTETSTIISAVQGNNEISFWDLETGSRHKTLWASTAPPLSLTQATAHSINGMYFGKTDMNTFLLAAGSDMRVRYWDLGYSANSQLITGAATDPTHNQMAVSYRSRLIDGTEVIQETYGKHKKQAEEMPRKGPDLPPTGHHDIITDISICQPSQCFMITSSRDGVVKVWK